MLRSGGKGGHVCMYIYYYVSSNEVVHNFFLPLYLAAGLIVMLTATSGHGWVVTLNLTPENAAGVGDIIPLYLLPQNNFRCAAAANRSGIYLVCRICRPLWIPFLALVVVAWRLVRHCQTELPILFGRDNSYN